MRRLILGTAGHIDHGKTSLVRALTGVDTDRLPEEKRRGITIDLGFAALTLGDIELGIVDVPGHEALVRNMLAGATGIDLVLVVIAADEGVMPQTREHLAIMDLLEVNAAVVALTKSDLVDDDWIDLVSTDINETVAATRFAGAPIIPVSSSTGDGLDALRAALSTASQGIDAGSRTDLFRLPVDRVFTVRGTGTVVTGTIWSGEVRRDAQLAIMPAGDAVRVRGLQVHGHPQETAGAGERVALALAIDRDDIQRGDTLTGATAWPSSMLITARMRVLPASERALTHRQRIRFHLGTSEILGRIALLDREEIPPGSEAWVQLRLEAPCTARAGDRFVIRSYSPVRTIAGGIVVEPRPLKRKRLLPADLEYLVRISLPDAAAAINAILSYAGGAGVAAADLPALVPFDRATVDDTLVQGGVALSLGARLYLPSLAEAAAAGLLSAIDSHHARHPLSAGIPREELRALTGAAGAAVLDHVIQAHVASGALRSVDGRLARPSFKLSLDAAQTAAANRLLHAIESAGLEPPAIAELPADLQAVPELLTILRFLEHEGRIVSVEPDRFAWAPTLTALAVRLDRRFDAGQSLTTSALKEAVGVSRKYLIPLLEYFDRAGFTRRSGETRTWIGVATESGITSDSVVGGAR